MVFVAEITQHCPVSVIGLHKTDQIQNDIAFHILAGLSHGLFPYGLLQHYLAHGQDQDFQEPSPENFLIAGIFFFIFLLHAPEKLQDAAVFVMKNSVCGGLAEILSVIPDETYAQQLIKRLMSGQGIVNDFCQKQAVNQGKGSAVLIAVTAAVIDDKIIAVADCGGNLVQGLLGSAAGHISKFKTVVVVCADILL